MESMKWFDRKFELGLPPWMFPDLLERLRGTPARIEDRVRLLPREVLIKRIDNRWSIQEHAGHLLDLEELWQGRMEDFASHRKALRPADLENRKTHAAHHNDAHIANLLARFREEREELISCLEALDEHAVARTAYHPRLNQPMTVTDLMFFIAEHDDHHLAKISEILQQTVQ